MVHVGIGSLVCITNLLIAPVRNVLMRMIRAKELRILAGSAFFQIWKHNESHTYA